MRGKSKAYCIIADDGHHYVAKQADVASRRLLINECVGNVIHRLLGVTTPEVRRLQIPTAHFLPDNLGTLRPGCHFASQMPADPRRTSLWDFLPGTLGTRVINQPEFDVVVAADIWLSNAAVRQAVYVRDQRHEQHYFRAYFVDNDELLSGPVWSVEGLYFQARKLDALFFRRLPTQDSLMDAVDRIMTLDINTIYEKTLALGNCWILDGDEKAFLEAMAQLDQKRRKLPELVTQYLDCLRTCVGSRPLLPTASSCRGGSSLDERQPEGHRKQSRWLKSSDFRPLG
jgi:hypothetical protein